LRQSKSASKCPVEAEYGTFSSVDRPARAPRLASKSVWKSRGSFVIDVLHTENARSESRSSRPLAADSGLSEDQKKLCFGIANTS